MASEIKVDTISEKTSTNGVTIDSLSIKDGGLVAAGNIDVNGNNLVLDANANTYLDAGTDDTIKIYVAGAHDATISANAINVLSGTTLTIDSGATITNSGTANGFGALAGIDDQTSSNDDQLTITDSAVIINEDSDDLDFRVESNGNANMLFVDGGNDRVQIGSATSVAGGDSTGTLQITGANANPIIGLNAFKTDDGGPAFVFFKSRNATPGSRTIVADNDELGSIKFAADDGGDYVTVGANIKAKVDGTPGANDLPTELIFGTTADGANGTTDHLKITPAGNVGILTGNLTIIDDKGIIFGSDGDYFLGAQAGENYLNVYRGNSQGADTNEGYIQMKVGDSDHSHISIIAGEGGADAKAFLFQYADQGDDAADQWNNYSHGGDGKWTLDSGSNTATQNFSFTGAGVADADSTWNDNSWDYAELFQWKTALSNDGDINALWGMTVVLDGDFVRIAEAGEESKVMGVVRPKSSTAAHGDGLGWQGKWKKDVFGNDEYEGYTQVNWQEHDSDGRVSYRHAYAKDEIPAYRLKQSARDRNKNNHLKEANFELDKSGNKIPVVVPSTVEEIAARNYIERTTHKSNGTVLKRRIFADDYDETQAYVRREDRPREWVLIGLLGQVPIRDTAVITTTWTKMKNVGTGVDLYFIK